MSDADADGARTAEASASRLVVDLIGRKPFPGQFSVEIAFARIGAALARHGVTARQREAPAHSKGLLDRLRIARFAARRTGADIAHVTGDIHFAVLAAPRPVVLTVLDLERLGRLTGLRRAVLRLVWFALPCRRADAITVISAATGARLVAEIPGIVGKVHVVPVVVSEAFRPIAKPFDAARPTVLAVGTKANKNLPRLAASMEGLAARLVVVGRVDDALAATLDRHGLDWTAHVGVSEAELVALYAAADVLAFVSTEEGFGMPIIEAQRVGRPVLTADVSSMPEVAGEGALLVDPFDVGAIRAGLERLIADAPLRERLVAAGFDNAARFEADTVARHLAAIYVGLARGRGH